MPLLEWQVREKHYTDERNVRNAQGGMGVFNGKTFWPAFQELGHTSLVLKDCACFIPYVNQSCDLCLKCSAPKERRPETKTLLGRKPNQSCPYFQPKG